MEEVRTANDVVQIIEAIMDGTAYLNGAEEGIPDTEHRMKDAEDVVDAYVLQEIQSLRKGIQDVFEQDKSEVGQLLKAAGLEIRPIER